MPLRGPAEGATGVVIAVSERAQPFESFGQFDGRRRLVQADIVELRPHAYARLVRQLEPPGGSRVVEGALGDNAVQFADEGGCHRLVNVLADELHGRVVVDDHALGAVPWFALGAEEFFGNPPGSDRTLQLGRPDRFLHQ